MLRALIERKENTITTQLFGTTIKDILGIICVLDGKCDTVNGICLIR